MERRTSAYSIPSFLVEIVFTRGPSAPGDMLLIFARAFYDKKKERKNKKEIRGKIKDKSIVIRRLNSSPEELIIYREDR